MKRVQRDGFTVISVDDEPLPEERPRFLIDGMVARSLTLLYGQPKHGKSTMAQALAIAVSNGHSEFLGRKVNVDEPTKVAVIAGDPEDDIEYANALRGRVPEGMVMAYCPQRPPTAEHWQNALSEIRLWGAKLVIIDNLQAFVSDVNESKWVAQMLDRCDQLARSGIAVILLHHASEKSDGHGPRTTPLGVNSISSRSRWKVRLHLPPTGPLKVHCEGNGAAEHEMELTRPNGHPSFELMGTKDSGTIIAEKEQRRRQRSKEWMDENQRIWAVMDQGKSYRQVAAEMGINKNRVESAARARRKAA